ncbi:hypothetical protein BU14_0285s0011 [Porphyra umbilicalis]|uniref:Cwf15/Cwc15 cell cycle control protein n=1 Tax=Porphyra umbilicalis TaxID=2786 RepID=A0A1X6P1L2_PORUM|nr:hypothetical protein BU14_0285s0011 [Porphyra umbilicalis]|eukprot:OSX74523.1 hypothetical protein BU14_0285s0011 [Porphyra umbilicalis]
MTTAHRATYKPARGASSGGARSIVRSAAVSGRDGVNHTVLKTRERLPLGASLGSDDDETVAGDPSTGALGGIVSTDVGVGVGGAGGKRRRRRARPALPPVTPAADVAAAAARYADADADVVLSSDGDTDGGAEDGADAGGVADTEEDDDGSDGDEEDDEDDDDAELLRELELIKAERAAERARAEADAADDGDGGADGGGGGLLGDNPLLADSTTGAPSEVGTAGGGAFQVRRRWDDDVVFRHQTRGQVVPAKRFINDTVRNDFHRRFLDKYIR